MESRTAQNSIYIHTKYTSFASFASFAGNPNEANEAKEAFCWGWLRHG